MSEDFLNAVNDEIVRLEEELAENVSFVRWRELQKVRSLYNRVPNTTFGRNWERLHVRPSELRPPQSRAPSGPRLAMIGLVRNLLRGRDYPTPTRDVLQFLQESGFQIPGKDPVSNLSAMLSNSEQFVSHGRSGWTYSNPDENRTDDEEEEEDDDKRSLQQIMDELI